MIHILARLILLLSLLFLLIQKSDLLHAEGAFGCGGWTLGFDCADPGMINVCDGADCSLSGGTTAVRSSVNGFFSGKNISEYSAEVVLYFLGFVSLIAVLFILYSGAQLMTGGGDEEKVKKAKQIIISVFAGILLMWLAYWIVRIIVEVL